MTNEDESGLRSAVKESEREQQALSDMFEQDTGADHADVEHHGWGTEVTLTFYPDDFGGDSDE